MRDIFHHYYRPSDETFERWWREGIFIPDANVLLNLYRLNQETRDAILAAMGKLEDRLWIPHQFALEFHQNRLRVIHESRATYSLLKGLLGETKTKVGACITNHRRDSVIDVAALEDALVSGLSVIEERLENLESAHPIQLRSAIKNDPILDEVTRLFHGRIGPLYDEGRRKEMLAEANKRIESKVPPGYSDAAKGERATGDAVAWLQVLDWAKDRGLPVILVTDDRKEDWYRKVGSTLVGPRPELIAEMKDVANVDFYLYGTNSFLRYANQYLTASISEQIIEEHHEANAYHLEREYVELSTEVRVLEERLAESRMERERWVHHIAGRKAIVAELKQQSSLISARSEALQHVLRTLDTALTDHPEQFRQLQVELEDLRREEASIDAQIRMQQAAIAQAESYRPSLREVEQRIDELEHRKREAEMRLRSTVRYSVPESDG